MNLHRRLLLLCLLVSLSACQSVEVIDTSYRVRKGVKELTAAEKADYVAAVLKMKSVPSPYDTSVNYYDQFVKWHLEAFNCDIAAAHMGPAFLPWHRQFLLMYEKALGEVSGKPIDLPYWDFSDPSSFDIMFANDFMGGGGDASDNYAVKTGPFQKGAWTLNILDPIDEAPVQFPFLTRAFGTYKKSGFPSATDIAYTLDRPQYDAAPWNHRSDTALSFRNSLEGWRGCFDTADCFMGLIEPEHCRADTILSSKMHNVVHLLVGGIWQDSIGGTITAMTSPNDPAFFVLHANIDRLWSAWEERHPDAYLPVTGGEPGHNLNDLMWPYRTIGLSISPRSMLTTKAQGYIYNSLP